MAKIVPESLFKGEAYRLYHQEYRDRIEALEQYLNGSADAQSQSELRARFHTLKGGAGFFGFEEVYQIAARIEALLSVPAALATADRELISGNLAELREYQERMPEPVTRI